MPGGWAITAGSLAHEITFQRLSGVAVTAAEAFGLIVRALEQFLSRRQMPDSVVCERVFNPTRRPLASAREFAGSWQAFGHAVRAAAQAVVETPPPVKPYATGGAVEMEVELNDTPYLETVRRELPDEMKDLRTLAISTKTATAAFAAYWAKKLHCQAKMAEA